MHGQKCKVTILQLWFEVQYWGHAQSARTIKLADASYLFSLVSLLFCSSQKGAAYISILSIPRWGGLYTVVSWKDHNCTSKDLQDKITITCLFALYDMLFVTRDLHCGAYLVLRGLYVASYSVDSLKLWHEHWRSGCFSAEWDSATVKLDSAATCPRCFLSC